MSQISRTPRGAALRLSPFARSAALFVLAGAACLIHGADFSIKNGIVYYPAQDGKPRAISLGNACTDLWVAPDASAFTFVGIDKARKPDGTEWLLGQQTEPLIERSSIYVARRADGFAPLRVVSRPFKIDGRTWEVLRHPSLSPGGEKLFFVIPYTMTTWKLISYSTRKGLYGTVGDATDYCIIWGGPYSGDQILQSRYLQAAGAGGIAYRCYLRRAMGTSIISADCPVFEEFVSGWAKNNGGTCGAPRDGN